MSLEAVVWTLKHSPLNTKGILVHVAMANVVNDLYDNQVFMKLDTLAEVSRCSRATVCATIAQLLDLGLLERVDSDEETKLRQSQHKPTRYRFLMPDSGVQGLDSEPEAGSRVWTPRGPESRRRGVQGLDPHVEEENNGESNSVNTTPAADASEGESEPLTLTIEEPRPWRDTSWDFEHFWNAYGKKKNPKTARKAWDKALKEGADPSEIIDAARAYSASIPSERRQFQPYPASWLNAGGWLNEIEPPPLTIEQQREERNRRAAEKAAVEDERRARMEAERAAQWGAS